MSAARPSNHPNIISGHFEATADSQLYVVRGNQYGYVTTGTFFQCSGVAGKKEIDFEVKLVANTVISNALEEGILYSLTGARLIALNDGSTPTITYTQDSIMRIGKAVDCGLDFSNQTGVVGLGIIVEKSEIPSPHVREDVQLLVFVSHNDWDPMARCHHPFLTKYIVPASKNLVKMHVLYVLGREMSIVGHWVDWHIAGKMMVVLVGGLSVTSGQQNPRSALKGGSDPSTPSGRGRKLFTFKKGKASPLTPSPTLSGSGSSTPASVS
ncbi:hypothetical protein PTTG_27440 [Puccinia triticina 1-1 BBBD Race 1]|uniref:Uncharacterized protein n=1 Tax=Puccinia triticina (isolate 1-1 / race 1 (BBBD)) TaxID=630390 RepID=A0A180GK60_PUCT1|nr:hypothetical protein PTTG_27440 [Puccinia triticina 1-1 BBBD Race 1]